MFQTPHLGQAVPSAFVVEPDYVRRHVIAMARLYLELGGRSFRLSDNLGLARDVIGSALAELVKADLAGHSSQAIAATASPLYQFGAFYLEVAVQVELYTTFALEFLEPLSRQRPRVYRFVRDLIRGLGLTGPVMTSNEYIDGHDLEQWLMDMYESGKDRQQALTETEAELAGMRTHYWRGANAAEEAGVWCRRMRRRMDKLNLQRAERCWALEALEAIALSGWALATKPYEYECDDIERLSLPHMFMMQWSRVGWFTDYFAEDMQNSGDYAPAAVCFMVHNPEDLDQARSAVRYLSALSNVMWKGDDLWNARSNL